MKTSTAPMSRPRSPQPDQVCRGPEDGDQDADDDHDDEEEEEEEVVVVEEGIVDEGGKGVDTDGPTTPPRWWAELEEDKEEADEEEDEEEYEEEEEETEDRAVARARAVRAEASSDCSWGSESMKLAPAAPAIVMPPDLLTESAAVAAFSAMGEDEDEEEEDAAFGEGEGAGKGGPPSAGVMRRTTLVTSSRVSDRRSSHVAWGTEGSARRLAVTPAPTPASTAAPAPRLALLLTWALAEDEGELREVEAEAGVGGPAPPTPAWCGEGWAARETDTDIIDDDVVDCDEFEGDEGGTGEDDCC